MPLETKQGFEPNHREFGMHIRSEVARKPAVIIAGKIAAAANTRAPFDPNRDPEDSGPRLKGSYRFGPAGNLRVGRNSRAIAAVWTNVGHSVAVEFGNKNSPAQHVLLGAAITVIATELPGGANIRSSETP